MRLVRLLTVLTLVAIVSALAAPHAFAQVRVVQTDCDTLSLDPPLVRVTFGVINLGTIPVCSVHLTPIQSGPTPADSCRILECSFPPGWFCQLDPAGGAFWRALPDSAGTFGNCVLHGEKHEPFDIVLDPLFCCYRAEFDDPSGQIFYSDIVCFECEKPVATKNTTWGSLKSAYR